MKKGTKLYSILNGKCPHCHEGDFFLSNLYDLRKLDDNYDNCPKCNETFNLDPGFYFGAMYISYALVTALMVTVWVALIVLSIEVELLHKIIGISIIWLLLTPVIHSLSKIIWANIFMQYKTNNNLNK